jgi:hypothetical protein
MLGIGRDKLYDLMRSGRLRSVKDGRARFITASAPAESKPRLTEPYQRPCSRRSRARIRREPGASSVAPYTRAYSQDGSRTPQPIEKPGSRLAKPGF